MKRSINRQRVKYCKIDAANGNNGRYISHSDMINLFVKEIQPPSHIQLSGEEFLNSGDFTVNKRIESSENEEISYASDDPAPSIRMISGSGTPFGKLALYLADQVQKTKKIIITEARASGTVYSDDMELIKKHYPAESNPYILFLMSIGGSLDLTIIDNTCMSKNNYLLGYNRAVMVIDQSRDKLTFIINKNSSSKLVVDSGSAHKKKPGKLLEIKIYLKDIKIEDDPIASSSCREPCKFIL